MITPDAIGLENGFIYSLVADIFPIQPMVISVSADIGTLGHALFFNGRMTIGANIRRAEIYAGYNVMIIGPVPFHGPLCGFRLWI